MVRLAVIRVRGQISINIEVKDTFDMLGLYRKNYCIIREDSPAIRGMIRKVKDYVAWGEVGEDVAKGFTGRFIKLSYTRYLATGRNKDIQKHIIKGMLNDG